MFVNTNFGQNLVSANIKQGVHYISFKFLDVIYISLKQSIFPIMKNGKLRRQSNSPSWRTPRFCPVYNWIPMPATATRTSPSPTYVPPTVSTDDILVWFADKAAEVVDGKTQAVGTILYVELPKSIWCNFYIRNNAIFKCRHILHSIWYNLIKFTIFTSDRM